MLANEPQSEEITSANTRSVVTFYHEAFDEQGSSIKQEVDLLDYEVLVETYKFLAKNLRRQRDSTSIRHRRLKDFSSEDSENETPPSANNETRQKNSHGDIVTEQHKQAILTLVEIDKDTKRVVRIRPEFFPSNTRILPACLNNLGALKSLSLCHCTELTCLPTEFCFPQLVDLRIDVTSFREPLPSSFGNLVNLEILVVRGTCAVDWRSKAKELFPPSLAKIVNLKHLETHVRNLLQIPADALESWSLSLETLVTTQDLLSNSNETQERTPPLRNRSYTSDDSSDDDFFHLMDSSDDDDDDNSDDGFSLLKHSSVFRKALESQLEVRAFRAIAKFQNLRSLKLLFDDGKHRTDLSAIRNRLKRKHQKGETPYCVPLSLLAGPLSLSLRELDIGTCVASKTPSSSKKKSRIPIEIAWVDVLQDFPMLQTLRLQDCRASFSSKTQTVDLTASTMASEHETILCMPELKHLVLDRCPDFALVGHCNDVDNNEQQIPQTVSSPSSSSFSDDIEIIDGKDIDNDDGSEEIVFLPTEDERPSNQPHYFQPLNDADVDAMVEEDPEEISRIIRLSGLLADTLLTPKDEDEDDDEADRKLEDFCKLFLKRCPKLEIVNLRDCKIPAMHPTLLDCLPRTNLREVTLDVLECNQELLWKLLEAYPLLMRLQGTCLDGLSQADHERLHRRLHHNQSQQGNQPWKPFWDHKNKKQEPQTDINHLLEIRFPSGERNENKKVLEDEEEDRIPPPLQNNKNNNALHLLASKIFFFDHRRRQCQNSASGASSGGRVLQTIRRSNSRDVM
mmetsp:Transcript_5857/g.14127  ORF Transcript_5857/g.14127 Transcript_5857/m.14127 type:complete len:794 (-) Transcript_5857:112-2493(-)